MDVFHGSSAAGAITVLLIAACAKPERGSPTAADDASEYVIPLGRRELLLRPVQLGWLDPAALVHVPRAQGELVDAHALAPRAVRFTVGRGSAESVAFTGHGSAAFGNDGSATLPWPGGSREATYRIEGLAGDGTDENVTLTATALQR